MSAPQTKAGRLQRALLALLHQHRDDGALPTNGRFLFYELEQAGVIPKQYLDADGRKLARQPGSDIARELMNLRERGLVPWHWIDDETRTIHDWEMASTVFEFVKAQIKHARIDLWADKPAPLVICESRAVMGVLRNIAAEYLVPITATGGQCGGFIVNEIVPLLIDNDRPVLYVGDYELRGPADQIEANTRRRIEEHSGRVFDAESWQRIALTQEQVECDPRLLALVIEKEDRRYKPPKIYQAVECEAIKQAALQEIFRRRLDELLPELLAVVRERESEQRDDMQNTFDEIGGAP